MPAMATTNTTTTKKLLDGLLSSEFDEQSSCVSRYESALIRKESQHKPSGYLQERLRKYEALHKKCGAYTELYNQSVRHMKSNDSTENDDTECKYLVWISYSGLGNKILSLTSAFLLALLSNRVLLIDNGGTDMSSLFCEPFPNVSWILPLDFNLKQFDKKSPHSYGNMVKNKVIDDAAIGVLPGYVYVHLSHDYEEEDKLFFCEQDQLLLQKIPWMLLRSNNYFVPSLFLIPAYEDELKWLFPKKDTVFHHLGRYLFHPTNSVWGLISRYYQAYLAKADERLGIQIRIFDEGTGPFPYVMDQIFSCLSREKLLADTDQTNQMVSTKVIGKSKAVLVTSLTPGYSERLKEMYWEHPTWNGDAVSVYQPSQEDHQQTENHSHNMKAWAEIYLLSLTDELVTSSWSTFGYVAQGLGGLTPWIMTKPVNRTTPDPPCKQAMSMEPCFHAPPFYDCKAKRGIDTGAIVPHVRHCEDMTWGLKLVDRNQW